MTMAARPARKPTAYARAIEVMGLVLLAYVPFLLSSAGTLSSDTKQYLYLDPGRLLSRAPYLWDPHVAAGTVPHQQIGYLFPMGPYYLVMDRLGVPDWIAQRLWWGTISLVAILGARWLFTMLGTRRSGALVGALVYGLTPFQLAFTARISVLLLPWAALPWLVGLTMRAARRGGWRDPALFALVTLTVGAVNASALLLVGIAPVLWLVLELFRGRDAARAALAAAARIAVLAAGVSIWFGVGLRLQGAYGLPILQLTENLRTVSEASSPDDLLRGLGNWFFYGHDRAGYSIDQAADYLTNNFVILASYAVPVAGLLAAAVLRWRHRAYFMLLVLIGAIIGVGAWPFDDPSPYGRVWKSFADNWSIGLALRNTPRVVPVIVLGFAGLLAAAVGSLSRRRPEVVASVAVSTLAVAALWPVWTTGYLSTGVERPNRIPSYWTEAAASLQRAGNSTRVLEIPGSSFATYRWGNAVEPVTPGLIDRPYVAREVLPFGTPQSANLLDAFDRRLQQGTFEPTALAPFARLLGVGTVSLRSDLQYERSGTPRPRQLWAQLTDPTAPGLVAPDGYGPAVPNRPPSRLRLVDELELRTPASAPDPPPVALFGVEDPVPIVHTAPASQPVVLAGDGDGIVDAAAAGLLDGNALVLALASMDDAQLRRALDSGADLVLTDSNRRRIQTWFASVRDTRGATERAGQTTTDPNGYDFRLDVFPGATDATRTVVEQRGGRVDATGDGGSGRPEDRPAGAFDGDLRTAWRVGGEDPTGQRLLLRSARPVRADRLTLVQPQDGPRDRVLTKVRLRFDEGEPVTRDLGPDSLAPRGAVVRFPVRTFHRLEIELLETSTPALDPSLANAVGFAEVRLDGVQVTETVRLPVDLAQRLGAGARGHRLDVVVSRLRYDPSERGRQDEELALDRRVVLPDVRRFQLAGTARVNPNARDDVLDAVLGTVAPGTTFSAFSHLAGDVNARASRAFDGDPATAWTASLGPQQGQWLDVELPARATVDHAELTVVADGRHSVPTRLRLEADGVTVRALRLPKIVDAARDGAARKVTVTFPAVDAQHLRLVVEEVRRETAVPGDPNPASTLPVSIVDAGLAGAVAGVPTPAAPRDVAASCRDDLVRVDGRALPVRVTGAIADARRGLAIAACEGPVELGGSHRLQARPGLDSGIDVDRVVLASDANGNPVPVTPAGAPLEASGATVRVADSDSTSFDLRVRTDGKPFWLVLGQSQSEGWKAETSGRSLGTRQVVDGYANGWLVQPPRPGTMSIELRWAPQRSVWVGLALSVIAVLVCAGIVVVTSRGTRHQLVSASPSAALADAPVLVSPFSYRAGPPPAWGATVALGGALAIATAAMSRPWIGLVAGTATIVARFPGAHWLVTLAIPVLLAFGRLSHTPELAWLALALLAVDLGCGWLRAKPLRR